MVCLLSYHIEILSFDIAVFIGIILFYKNWEVCGRVSDCEELVEGFTGDDVIDIERNIFI